jgi:hypothetical protein
MVEQRYAPYARETAICVQFAYRSFEEDLEQELMTAEGEAREVLLRLLRTLKGRRAALDRFTQIVASRTT